MQCCKIKHAIIPIRFIFNLLKCLCNYLSGEEKCPRLIKNISNDNIQPKPVPTLTPDPPPENTHTQIFTFTQRFYQQICPQSSLAFVNRPPVHSGAGLVPNPHRGVETPIRGAILAAFHPSHCARAAFLGGNGSSHHSVREIAAPSGRS